MSKLVQTDASTDRQNQSLNPGAYTQAENLAVIAQVSQHLKQESCIRCPVFLTLECNNVIREAVCFDVEITVHFHTEGFEVYCTVYTFLK